MKPPAQHALQAPQVQQALQARQLPPVLCSLVLFASACGGRPAQIEDGSTPDVQDAAAPSLLANCTYYPDGVCWRCGGEKACPVVVGCRAKGDCVFFCDRGMPADYTKCVEQEPNCKGWKRPVGRLAACSYHAGGSEPPSYFCCFCDSIDLSGKWAKDAAGTCVHFGTSCMAAGFTAASPGACPWP